ncbi:MAG TPA: hypothetical protein VLL52_11200, partial [Anaerolineae bacterium]|nr:hypothetical protein [Anaerolineae bacterium]
FIFTPLICTFPNLPIPDNDTTGIATDLTFTTDAPLTDLEIILNINHTWVGDLQVDLQHVDTGTTVTLIDRPGIPNSDFGCSGDHIDAILRDDARDPVEDACANTPPTINGTFSPNQPLSTFATETLSGTWRLTATDFVNGDEGTINHWCLAPITSNLNPSLTLTTTVSTQLNVCGPDSGPVVTSANTAVTYCYTIANTGNAILATHHLSTTLSGLILDTAPHTLLPGQTFSFLETVPTGIPDPPYPHLITNCAQWWADTDNGSNTALSNNSCASVSINAPTDVSLTTIHTTPPPFPYLLLLLLLTLLLSGGYYRYHTIPK